MTRKTTSIPFRVRCEVCGTVAESWSEHAPAPRGAPVGSAHCTCGTVTIDALGPYGKGRVVSHDPDARWQITA